MTISELFKWLFIGYSASFVLGFLISSVKSYFNDLLN